MGKSSIAILEISYLAMWDHTRCTHFLSIGIYQHAGILETAKNDMQDDLSLMYLSMSQNFGVWTHAHMKFLIASLSFNWNNIKCFEDQLGNQGIL